jgi:tetratricopeptide (TPR) repeat protein
MIFFIILNINFSYCDELKNKINKLYNSGEIESSLDLLINNMEKVKKNPNLYGKLIFSFDEKMILNRFNLTKSINESIQYLNKNELKKASDLLQKIIKTDPLCYPAYDLLTTIFLKGNSKCIKELITRVPIPLKIVYTAAFLYEQGKTKEAKTTINKLIRHKSYKNYLPMYKILGMFPESVVDFKQKADFSRKYMLEIKKFEYKNIIEVMLENGIISALESKFACRRNREELQSEIFMYITPEGKPIKELNKNNRKLMKCPCGVRYLLKTTKKSEYKIFCPIHGDN